MTQLEKPSTDLFDFVRSDDVLALAREHGIEVDWQGALVALISYLICEANIGCDEIANWALADGDDNLQLAVASEIFYQADLVDISGRLSVLTGHTPEEKRASFLGMLEQRLCDPLCPEDE